MSKTLQKTLAALLLTILYSIFLLGHPWGLGFTLLNFAFIGLVLIIYKSIRNSITNLLFLILSATLSFFFPISGYGFGQFLIVMTCFLLNSFALANLYSESIIRLNIKSLIAIPTLTFFRTFRELTDLILQLKNIKQFKSQVGGITITTTLRGILIAIPLLIIFSLLLFSADPLYQKMLLGWIPTIKLYFLDFVLKSLEIFFFFGLFLSTLTLKNYSFTEFSFLTKAAKYKAEIAIAISALVILLASYLLFQSQYLFATEESLKQMGFMWSEYTRRGYTELLLVSGISLFLTSLVIRRKDNLTAKQIQLISGIFLVEVLLLLASASWRVYKYQEQFGLTEARVLGIVISIWLFITVLLFLFRVAKTKIFEVLPTSFMLFLNTIMAIFLIQIINVPYIVGVVKQPTLGYGVDYRYIANLPSDAYPAWDKTLEYFQGVTVCDYEDQWAITNISTKLTYLQHKSQNNWNNGGSWNFADAKALEFLDQNSDRLRKAEAKLRNNCENYPPITNTPVNY